MKRVLKRLFEYVALALLIVTNKLKRKNFNFVK